MPISQSRMLNLIKAVDAYSSTLHSLTSFISSTASAIPPDPPPAILLSAITNIQQFAALAAVPQSLLTCVAEEKAHFKLNAARNERHARRAKRKRLAQRDLSPNLPPIPSHQLAPANSPAILSDIELAKLGVDFTLSGHKIEINNFYLEQGLPAPYPDQHDNSIPLTPDHKRHLGLPVEDDDSSLF